mmetsp:Transcript_32394/g.49021  ORF Transcript_32394/g.49021 Transcript_32394/m.49021 type:complete len:106 (-) Transcript_32394:1029-1346(-)
MCFVLFILSLSKKDPRSEERQNYIDTVGHKIQLDHSCRFRILVKLLQVCADSKSNKRNRKPPSTHAVHGKLQCFPFWYSLSNDDGQYSRADEISKHKLWKFVPKK